MKLTTEQIQAVTTGALRVYEKDSAVHFRRFNRKQEEMYRDICDFAYGAALSSAGVKLSFVTDSRHLFLDLDVTPSVRNYYSADVFVNDTPIGFLDNFTSPMPVVYGEQHFAPKKCRREFLLDEGEKKIVIHLPWSAITAVRELSLEDGASLLPFRHEKNILFFGDSITHGVDCLRPSNRYTARLCEALGADEVSKARAGDIFIPELLRQSDELQADCAVVAYGTNDWSGYERESVLKNCREFVFLLKEKLPNAVIYLLSPIWRKDCTEKRKYGSMELLERDMAEIAEETGGISFIGGSKLFPHDETLFGDERGLHPNDKGCEIYFQNLYREISKL